MRHRDETKRRGWLWKVLLAVGVVVILGAGAAGAYVLSLTSAFDSGTTKLDEVFPDEASRPSATPAEDGNPAAQNILLLGSDTRGEVGDDLDAVRGQRADTIMVAHIPANRQHVYVTSIMRDSWVQIPGHGEAKINAALSYGGVPLMVQTVESLLNSRIDHVAIIDFEGFKGLTDALGGVEVDNSVAFTRDGHTYAQGPITLNGEQALGFVRER